MSAGDQLKRPAVWVPLAIVGFVLTLVAGATGAYFALRSDTDSPAKSTEAFIAQGHVDALMIGLDGYTPQARQCIAETRFGTLKEGTPVTITLDGNVVGTGELKGGQYKENGALGAVCGFEVTVPVSEAVEGFNRYVVNISSSKLDASLDELRKGFNYGI